VDVGMSEGCANRCPEVLEIRGDKEVYRLKEGSEPVLLCVAAEVTESAPPESSSSSSPQSRDDPLKSNADKVAMHQ
jgi:hypothetical protein